MQYIPKKTQEEIFKRAKEIQAEGKTEALVNIGGFSSMNIYIVSDEKKDKKPETIFMFLEGPNDDPLLLNKKIYLGN